MNWDIILKIENMKGALYSFCYPYLNMRNDTFLKKVFSTTSLWSRNTGRNGVLKNNPVIIPGQYSPKNHARGGLQTISL